MTQMVDQSEIDFRSGEDDFRAMEEPDLSPTAVTFRIMRAAQFAKSWRNNAKRLQALASDPRTPKSARDDALREARAAAEIVARRGDEMAELARVRGFKTWEADPKLGPLIVEIRAVENALNFAAETLARS